MVHLTRIYTKTGDDGTTALGDMSRTSKNDPRIEAYATVDEANSFLGVAVSAGGLSGEVKALLLGVQNDLFDIGADLCTPILDSSAISKIRITKKQIESLEAAIDAFNSKLSPLNSFVLPSGTNGAAYLHVARTVVRRAERRIWGVIDIYGKGINRLTAVYMNRLSDLLFVLARHENLTSGDILWIPGENK